MRLHRAMKPFRLSALHDFLRRRRVPVLALLAMVCFQALGGPELLAAQERARRLAGERFTCDASRRLDTVTDPAGWVYVHGYDENGNRASLAHPNGVATSYQHDNRNRLRELTAVHAVSGTVVSYVYTLAATGQRTRITEQDGTTRHYGYDPLSRLTDEHVRTGPAPDAPTAWRNGFIYDPVGNRLHQERTQGAGAPLGVTYAYDSRDRLLTENEVAYGWDANGNQTSKTGPDGATYEWDYENRLTRVTLATGTTVEHTYDADGTRMRTRTTPATGPPTTIDYLVDPWHQTSAAGRSLILSQVVAESDATGALTAYHVRGDDLLATLRPNPTPPPGGSSWIARYFHAEGIGTIRALTDEAGEVTDRYTLEAFGTLLDHQGDDPNAYLFAGEPLGPNSDFYHLRARWMDPEVGRFASMDPFGGLQGEPVSLHRFGYGSNDPASRTDPTGRFTSVVVAVGVMATIGFLTLSSHLGPASWAELPLTVHVWNYRGKDEAWGHAALTLGDGTHISWWPSGVRFDQMPFLSDVYSAVPNDPQRFADDVTLEGQPPDEQIRVRCLDQRRIKTWWGHFQRSHLWRTLSQNCSTTVAEALESGGALPRYHFPWTPAKVSRYAWEVASSCGSGL